MKPCKHLEIQPDAIGRLIMRKDHGYKCMFPVPDFAALVPPSFSVKHGVQYPKTGMTVVFKDSCAKCPFYDNDRTPKPEPGFLL